jgi:hypothetical protein
MIYLVALALALDVLTTLYVLRHGGREIWPPTAWLMHRVGAIPALVATHVLLLVFVWWLRAWISPVWMTLVACGFLAGVASNTRAIARIRRSRR